ncbi:hypothetical protein D770_23830 [Flammeovirgaceae bacterium 311]|nr:hypothetical protein D770_23830 [Flammeovirgaceae bacterium 311]
MNTSALVLMLGTMLLVTGMTAYFFFKVLITPNKTDRNASQDEGIEP